MKLLEYCSKNNIKIRIAAPGTLRIFSGESINELKNSGFQFGVTHNIKEIYNNKKFRKSHKKQVEEFYGLE